MTVKLLIKHHLEFLSLKGGCRGSFESTLVKMPHCWKSHAVRHLPYYQHLSLKSSGSRLSSILSRVRIQMKSYSIGQLWNEYDSRYQTVMYVAVAPSSWIFLGSAIITQLEKMSLKRYSFVCSLELLGSQVQLIVCSCSRVCHLSFHCLSTIFTEVQG